MENSNEISSSPEQTKREREEEMTEEETKSSEAMDEHKGTMRRTEQRENQPECCAHRRYDNKWK